ncbi:cytochrome c oxidase subunit VIIc [Cokeromyces recurvatus]|uniref:cytochrome c oxidase subunit VIIc n=1 Tax=Cokeromyces recurvatus TaxID=90255 RepID=UPI00221EE5B9|nr:cytochrome c oxidase subunit VIIc [Cokeromyces recurvatus]KAI7902871.1 cytochrome c oxidase subunit VIIc [Cokeromyces recurvatus]
MISNVLARSTMRASTRQIARSDLYHFSNSNGQNIPFNTKNRAGLAIKMTLYLGIGFAAPFLGAWWQFYKAG